MLIQLVTTSVQHKKHAVLTISQTICDLGA